MRILCFVRDGLTTGTTEASEQIRMGTQRRREDQRNRSGREVPTAVGDNRSLPSLSGADRLEAKIRQIQKANRTRQMSEVFKA